MFEYEKLLEIGVKFEKDIFPEDISDDITRASLKLRLLAALQTDDNDRAKLNGLVTMLENMNHELQSWIHA